MMRELSLFTGAGGGLLGTMLLGWGPVGYVEWDRYCQRVIAQRIADGHLPAAPIFTDVRQFVLSGAAREYRGFADVVTAGFPCQPFSVAGRQGGADDERNMWPATLDTIRMVRPRYCLLENVPALVTSGYFGHILGGLAESGYDCRWRILSAAEMGAPHKRDRLWIVADRCGSGRQQERGSTPSHEEENEGWRTQDNHQPECHGQGSGERAVADANEEGLPQRQEDTRRSGETEREQEGDTTTGSSWWSAEPPLGRVVDGMADRVGQLKALGNGQVPAVVAAAWEMLA